MPIRQRWVDSGGVRIAVYEWGSESAPPLLLAHGGFELARSFDVFAPLLADAGWRVVSWDQRGHGRSDHTPLYSWDADLRDLLAVLDSTTVEACCGVGHSKGGRLLIGLAESLPQRLRKVVAIDGLPARTPKKDGERGRPFPEAEEIAQWLDQRRRAAHAVRRPGTPEELAERRHRMNPRLSRSWLLYLVSIGARQDPDGWRWRLDPTLRATGFGPWRDEEVSESILQRLRGFPVPLLGIIGTERDPMDWIVDSETVRPHLPPGARLEIVEDTGHFVHVEKPREVADLVLDFLAA